ncbi:restriction endonuclease subunit S [Porphyromonas gingivalis]|uniref:restriction endonuclease subunit S n=1 Tax=Porphyromonas gingivalis TaxID=837 RepID=UPI003342974C
MRFPQFNDQWKFATISEVCKTSTGSMNTQDKIEGGAYPFYVRSSTIERANKYTYDGIAILTPGDGAIGKVFHYSEGKIAVHQRVYILSDITIGTKYLFYYFADKFYNRVIRMSAKNTVDSVRMNMITDMPISLPSLAEQEKIAGFLSLIDERIESCSETIKEIKTLKAGLLSLRVYQADKQYVPLSYFGEMKHGYPFKSTSYDEDGTHRIVTISNVSGARYADMSKCNYLAELPHDIQQHQILSRNDILISLTGNVGRVSFCLADGDLLNQRVGVLSLCDEAYKEYIYQVLSDWRFEMSMVACGQGAAQLNISKSNVEGYLVPYEQSEYQEIGNFFSLLDDRIEIEEELLKQYEMQKKYLLRQMFI